MPDWEETDPKLRGWVAEGLNPVEMCRKLGWDRKKRQTIVDRLRKLGLKEPAQSKSTRETTMSAETTKTPVEVLPGQISLETADTPAEDTARVSATADMATVTAELVEDLSLVEVQTLERCEAIIAQGIKTFVDVGRALLIIRDQRLYRQAHGTFEDYLRQRWDLSRPYAYQLIDASVVVQNVSGVADIRPANEAQARPLTSLPPEQQREVWKEAVETAPASGVTAKHIQATVKRAKSQATGEKVSPPIPKEPEIRRPARQEVQEGLIWGLREVDDEDAWEMLEWLWDGLNDLAPKYQSLRGMLNRVKRRFPDGHRSLMEFTDDRQHSAE